MLDKKQIILVVIPTMENAYHNLKDFVAVCTPVGLTSIAAVALRENYNVSIIDGDAENLTMTQIIDIIIEKKPAFIGSTVMTATMGFTKQFYTMLKEKIPDTIVILGGPHVSALPEQTLLDIPAVDICVIGEGDHTIADILHSFKKNIDLQNVPGITFRKNNNIIRTSLRPPIRDLSSLPIPASHLLKKHLYKPYGWNKWVSGKNGPLGMILTSRGCIGKCNFCAAQTVFGFGARYYDMQQVINQLEFFINEWDIRILYILDDTFTLNRKRINELCDYIISKGYQKRLEIQVSSRVNTVHLPTMIKMRKAGVRWVFFGIESGNQEILNRMCKNITLKQIREAVKITRKAGIFVGGNYIIGNIGETRQTIMDTINLSCELDQDYASYATAIPLPGTELYQYCIENNVHLPNWNDFGNINTPPIQINKNLGIDELIELRDLAINKFFKRPLYFLKLLIRMKTYTVISNFIKMYFSIKKEKEEKRL